VSESPQARVSLTEIDDDILKFLVQNTTPEHMLILRDEITMQTQQGTLRRDPRGIALRGSSRYWLPLLVIHANKGSFAKATRGRLPDRWPPRATRRFSTLDVAKHTLAYFFVSHPPAGLKRSESRCQVRFLVLAREPSRARPGCTA